MKNRQSKAVLVVGLMIIGACAFMLRNIDRNRVMGEPGLVMIDGMVHDEEGNVVNTNTVALPESVLGYESTPRPITTVELGWLPADTTYARRVYHAPDGPAFQVNVVMMKRDRSSIHKPQICLTGQGWKIVSEHEESIPLNAGDVTRLPVWKMIAERDQIMSDGSHQKISAVYVYWFVAEDHVTARHGERMFWSARELLRNGVLQRWAYVSVLGICRPGEEEALYDRMTEFIAVSVPDYHRFSPDTIVSGGEGT